MLKATKNQRISEFEGRRQVKTRVFSESLLTNFREDERFESGEK